MDTPSTSVNVWDRRPTAAILGGMLLVWVLRGLVWGDITLSHENTTVPEGTPSVQVPLLINTPQLPATTALQVETTLAGELAGHLTAISTGPAAAAAEKVLVSSTTPSRVRYVIYGLNRNEMVSGSIAVLTFSLTGVPAGTYPLTLEDWAVASSSEGAAVPRTPQSGAIIITAGARPPQTPTDLQAEARSPTTIRLTWRNPPGPPADRILIQRSASDQGPFPQIDAVNPTPPRYEDSTRSPNTRWFYRLIAENGAGQSSPTAPQGAVTHANPPLAQSFGEVSVDRLTSNWGPNGNPSGTTYIVELSTRSGDSPPIASVTLTGTTHPFTGLTPNTEYHSQVKARNLGDVETAYTRLGSTVTLAATPIALPMTFISTTSFRSNWSRNGNPANSTDFYGELAATEDFSSLVGNTGWGRVAQFRFENLSPDTTYYFHVKARNQAGQETPFSNTQSAKTLTTLPDPPDAPPSLSLTEITSTTIRLTWQHNRQRVEEFLVERTTEWNPPANFVVVATVTAPTLTFVDTALQPATTYAYQIRASGVGGQSNPSPSQIAQTLPPAINPPAAVTNWQAMALTRQRVRLTWTHDGQRLSGFRLYRSMDPPRIPYEQIAELRDVAQRAYVDTRVPPGRLRTTRYHILAFGPGGESPRTETGVVQDSTPLGLTLNDLPELTNQASVSVALLVTAPSSSQDEREVLVTIERRTSQGQDQPLREVIPVGETQRRSVSLRDGRNELIFTLRDIVNEEAIHPPNRRPVVLDREPPRFVEVQDPQGSRRHRDVRHGFPRRFTPPVGAVNKDGVSIEANGVVLTRLVDQMGTPVNQPMAVLPVIQGRHILLRNPQQPQQPLELPGNSEYQLELVKEKIHDAAGNTLTGSVPTIRFRTTPLPIEPNQLVLRDRPRTLRLLIPAGTLRTESYLLVNQSEAFVDASVPERIRQAHDHLSRVANQFRLALPNKETEVSLFNAQDGAPIGSPITEQRTTGLTLTIPYETGGTPRALEASSGVGVDPRTLQVAWLNPTTQRWEPVPGSQVNPAEQTVSVPITQAGIYTLIGARTPAVSAIFAFPVPFQPGVDADHRTITFANTPKDTVIKIFTVAGDLVRELTAGDATGQVTWDVTNSAGERVASEVYLYVAEQGGDRKTGKLVVIR